MNVFIPQRGQHESYLDYRDRREKGNFLAKLAVKGVEPTLFVQHQPNGGVKARHQALKEKRNGNA